MIIPGVVASLKPELSVLSTKLLLHMDGPPASTTFIEETGKIVTPQGSIVLGTNAIKFGISSAYSPGGSSKLVVENNPSLNPGSKKFTIEFFMRALAVTGNLYSYKTTTTGHPSINISYLSDESISFTLNSSVTGAGGTGQVVGSGVFIDNWGHVALCRDGSIITLYVNGFVSASTAWAGATYLPNSGLELANFNGNMDEVRVTIGEALYTGEFTPPTAPFTLGTPVVLPSVLSSAINVGWMINGTISKSLNTSWAISEPLSRTMNLSWSINTLLTKSMDLSWAISPSLSKSTSVSWSIAQPLVNNIGIGWSTGQVLQSSITTGWDVGIVLQKPLNISWTISPELEKALNIDWSVGIPITNTLTSNWSIGTPIQKTLNISWNIS